MDSQSNQSTQEMSSLHQIKQSDIVNNFLLVILVTFLNNFLSIISKYFFLQSEADGQQAVALADGRIMMLSDYKRFLLAKKKQARPSQVG